MVLAALRRRGEWLELRLVAETASATEAIVHGPFDEARDADLLGRPLGAIEIGRRDAARAARAMGDPDGPIAVLDGLRPTLTGRPERTGCGPEHTRVGPRVEMLVQR